MVWYTKTFLSEKFYDRRSVLFFP